MRVGHIRQMFRITFTSLLYCMHFEGAQLMWNATHAGSGSSCRTPPVYQSAICTQGCTTQPEVWGGGTAGEKQKHSSFHVHVHYRVLDCGKGFIRAQLFFAILFKNGSYSNPESDCSRGRNVCVPEIKSSVCACVYRCKVAQARADIVEG